MGSPHIFSRAGRSVASVTDRIYHAIGSGPLGRLFTSYQALDHYFQSSALAGMMYGKKKKSKRHVIRRGLAAAMDQSLLRRAAYGGVSGICRCSVRTLGAFFLTFGIYVALITWLIAAVWQNAAIDGRHLFFAGAMLLVGILLSFSKQSVAHMLMRGRVIGLLIHGSLGLSDDYIKDIPEKGVTMYSSAIPLGMLAGTVTAITGPFYPMIALLIALFVMIALTTPEAGILLLLVFAPFMDLLPYSELWPVLGVLLSFAGFVFKLMRGTRAFRMEIQDLAVLALLIATLLSAVSAAGGSAYKGAFLSAILMMVYFPAVNVLSTPTWLSRCRWGLLVSATVVALVGVLQFAVALLISVQGVQSLSMSALGTSVRAGFSSHTTMAYFLALVFPFTMHAFIRSKNGRNRAVAGFATIAVLVATVLTWLPGAWIAIALEIVVLLLFCKRSLFPYFVLFLLSLPVVFVLLPDARQDAILALFGGRESFADAKLTMKILLGEEGNVLRLLFGVGFDGAKRIGILYTGGSAQAVTNTLNFWWEQWLAGGVVLLLLSILLFFFLLQNCCSLLSRTSKEQSAVAPVSGVAMALGAIALSFFHCVWGDPVALLLFFVLLSIVTADARVRRAERVEMGSVEQNDSRVELEYRVKEKRRKKLSVRKEIGHE